MKQKKQGSPLSSAGAVVVEAHLLQLFVGLSRLDSDAMMLRSTTVSVPLVPLILAIAELGALLAVDVRMFRLRERKERRIQMIFWLISLGLGLYWAWYSLPVPPVITYQADRVLNALLPAWLLSPQLALQVALYGLFPLLGEGAKAWLLQFGGAAFAGIHVVYLLGLMLRDKRTAKAQ